MKTTLLRLAVAVGVLSSFTAHASDPTGIYAIVEKVTVAPNETMPETVQIVGTFSLAKPGGRGEEYTAPQRGYLFYKASGEDKDICRKEWADLKSVAGQDVCVGFASRHKEKGKVRPLDEKPAKPDPYPVANGVVKVKRSEYPPVKRLYEAAASHDSKQPPQKGAQPK